MHIFIEYDSLLKRYNTIWDKVSADIKKEFISEPVYNKEFLKTKIKSQCNEVTDFYDKEIPKVGSNHTCLAESAEILLSRKITVIIRKCF